LQQQKKLQPATAQAKEKKRVPTNAANTEATQEKQKLLKTQNLKSLLRQKKSLTPSTTTSG
jgi:hypothetical protein